MRWWPRRSGADSRLLAVVSYCSWVTRETEGETERDRWRYMRGLFDQVARLYEATLEAAVTMARVRKPACDG